MADEALKSLKALLESVPGWIADLEGMLQASTERQNVFLLEHQPVDAAVPLSWKPSKSSSLRSKRSKSNKHGHDAAKIAHKDDEDTKPSRPQLPHMTSSDALRLARRKRKTTSALSNQSGPQKYRSKDMGVVYYDGDMQKQFESLVRAMGGSRNTLRKGKMNARVDALSRTGSASSSEASNNQDRVVRLSNKFSYTTTRGTVMSDGAEAKDHVTESFDTLDTLLQKAQTLCEKAAHQVLRDGDCALELRMATQHFADLRKVAEDGLPELEKRAEKATERRERERLKEQVRQAASVQEKEKEKTENPFLSRALVVDLEADDESDEDEDIDFQMELGRFGIRTARSHAVGTA